MLLYKVLFLAASINVSVNADAMFLAQDSLISGKLFGFREETYACWN